MSISLNSLYILFCVINQNIFHTSEIKYIFLKPVGIQSIQRNNISACFNKTIDSSIKDKKLSMKVINRGCSWIQLRFSYWHRRSFEGTKPGDYGEQRDAKRNKSGFNLHCCMGRRVVVKEERKEAR